MTLLKSLVCFFIGHNWTSIPDTETHDPYCRFWRPAIRCPRCRKTKVVLPSL